jgi:GT2 family glycosyltransferase/glycosyltransferase involved in cell wall biosynthesis
VSDDSLRGDPEALAQLRAERDAALARAAALEDEAARVGAYARALEDAVAAKDRHIAWLEDVLRRVESGRVLRALRAAEALARRARGRAAPAPAPAAPTAAAPDPAYARWIAATEPGPAELDAQRAAAADLPRRPLISAVMPVFNPPLDALEAAIASLRAQTYDRWELCVADGGSRPEVRAALRRAARADRRVRLRLLSANRGIAGNSNAALALARGDYLLIFDHDDALAPDALFRVAELLAARPATDVVYFDEDKLSADGAARYEPWFKPAGHAPDLLLATNYLMHGVFRRELVRDVGGFDAAAEGAQDWDLALRCVERTAAIAHIPRVLYHWRAVPGSAASAANAKPFALRGQLHALAGHLGRTGSPDARLAVVGPGALRVRWPTSGQLVSIVIPNKDRAGLLRACLGSIFARTAYPAYEVVIVDTGTTDPDTLALYAELRADPRVRIVDLSGPFNWSRANNVGAAHARGELLLFLNNDTEALHPDWLDELAGWAERPEVGVVGCKLVRPDGTTQHAGMALGVEGHASSLFDGERGPVYGPFGSSEWSRDLSLVTGACMLTRREVLAAAGGFDEGYRVGYSDLTFCLAARALGLRVVYTPHATLLHHEGASRGFSLPPADVLRATLELLPAVAAGDPFYSPNLSPVSRRPAVADPAGERALERIARIVELFGLVEGDVAGRVRDLAARLPLPPPAPRPAGASPRVLLASHELSQSGAPILLLALGRHLAARGYAVRVATSRDGPLRGAVEAAGLPLEVAPRLFEDATLAHRLAREADVVVANTVLAMRVVHAARAAGTPCLWWVHEAGFGRELAATTPHTAAAFAAADAVVFPSHAQAALYRPWSPAGRAAIIPYGIDDPGLRPEAPAAERVLVAALASVEPRKGQDVLLRALAALDPALRALVDVTLVGVTIDRDYGRAVAAEAAALGGVTLAGEVSHAAALAHLRAATICCLPSRDDVLPVAILEAMALGVPILATAVGGVPELVRDGAEALLAPPDDPAALAQGLARLAADPALRAELARAARARYEARFTRARFLDAMADQVGALVGARTSAVSAS